MNELINIARLILLVGFAYAAFHDVKTRRVNDILWVLMSGVGIVLFIIEYIFVFSPQSVGKHTRALLLSVCIVGGLGWFFARMGWFGWADCGGFISVSIIYPLISPFTVFGTTFPVLGSEFTLLSLAIISNATILTLLSPLTLSIINSYRGEFSFPESFYSVLIPVDGLWEAHGVLMIESDDDSYHRSADLDVIRRYLQWRMLPVNDLVSNDANVLKHDISAAASHLSSLDVQSEPPFDDDSVDMTTMQINDDSDADDQWGVSLFFESTNVDKYGTTCEQLRSSLDELSSSQGDIRISLGQPFLLFLLFGIITALLFGNMVLLFL